MSSSGSVWPIGGGSERAIVDTRQHAGPHGLHRGTLGARRHGCGRPLSEGQLQALADLQGDSVTVTSPKFKIVNDSEPVIDPLATTHDGVAFPLVINGGATESGTFNVELDSASARLRDGPVRIEAVIGDVTIERDAVVATCG